MMVEDAFNHNMYAMAKYTVEMDQMRKQRCVNRGTVTVACGNVTGQTNV